MKDNIPKILYVDDEPDNIKVFRLTFNAYFDVYTALSAEEGLLILEKVKFGLVVSDERMPKMSGVEFLQIVCEKYPDTIRIILTGYSDMSSIVAAINKGRIYHYVTKPWEESHLKTIFDNALRQYHLAMENKSLMKHLKEAKEELELHNRSLEDTVRERMAQILEQQKSIQEMREKVVEIELYNTKKQKEELQAELDTINKRLTTISLQKIQKNRLLEELKGELNHILEKVDESYSRQIQKTIRFIVTTINTERDWEEFKLCFEKVHSDFYTALKNQFELLTPKEIHLCALLRLNLNIKQAAQILGIAPDSVKMSRHRVRKKMGIPSDTNLVEYLMNLSKKITTYKEIPNNDQKLKFMSSPN